METALLIIIVCVALCVLLGTLSTEACLRLNAHLYNNSNFADVGDATGLRGSTSAGNFYAALHTSSPGVGGSQNTNEISYTGYSRIAIPRDGTVLDGSTNPVALLSDLVFGLMTAGAGGTATHMSIGSASSGAGHLTQIFTLTPNIAVANGVTPRVLAGNVSTTS